MYGYNGVSLFIECIYLYIYRYMHTLYNGNGNWFRLTCEKMVSLMEAE